MPTSALYPGLTALRALGWSVQNTAHNLANVLTPGFKAGQMAFAELPSMSGVAASGPLPSPRPPQAPDAPEGWTEAACSDVDVVREMVNLIVTSRGYQANAKPIMTADDMLGVVINLKV